MSQAAIEFEDLHVDEEWRDIPNLPGYQASSIGRIKGSGLNNFSPTFGFKNKKGYMACNVMVKNKIYCVQIHRQVLLSFTDGPKEGEQCDHINRIRTDNRIENLRWATVTENALNKKTYGKSKFKGVCFLRGKYKTKDGTIKNYIRIKSQITINKNTRNLGTFDSEEEAHEAYKTAYKNHYGYDCPV